MRRRRAFSLVELLIVIGVIAILIGLLMPTVARARESAQRTACLSNMRQLAGGFIQYCADNRGFFPRPSQNIIYTPEDWIYYQYGRDPAQGRLVPYLGVPRRDQPGVYRCPSDDPESTCRSGPTRSTTASGSIIPLATASTTRCVAWPGPDCRR